MSITRLRSAGYELANRLSRTARNRPIVFAVPRCGAVVGTVIAQGLRVPMDVVPARRLTVGGLAIGAVALPEVRVVDPTNVTALGIDADTLDRAFDAGVASLRDRLPILRGDAPLPSLVGRSVIIVDDVAITGLTLHAAVRAIASHDTGTVTVAVAVATPEALARLRDVADDIVVLETVPRAIAIARHDADDVAICPPLTDAEIRGWAIESQIAAGNDLFGDLEVDGLEAR